MRWSAASRIALLRASLSRTASSARLRSRKRPTWLPTVASMSSRAGSGSRTSRPKNSITPTIAPATTNGKPIPVCRPSRSAIGERGKLSSTTTSVIHAGSRLAQTRPGRPTPGGKARPRLAASNAGKADDGAPHVGAAQHAGRGIDHPQRRPLPAEHLAEGAQDAGAGIGEGPRLGQRARGDVLRGQPPLGRPAAGDLLLRVAVEAGVVDGDRGAPRELLGEREVALVVAALDRGEGERAADLAARDERHDDRRAIAQRFPHRRA